MSDIPPGPSSAPPPRKLGWLRFLIWTLPSAILPMCLFGATQLRVLPYPLHIGGALALGLIIYLGHFNALLRCQQLGIPKDHPRAAIAGNIYSFVMLQILVIPALWFTLAFGFCMVAGAF